MRKNDWDAISVWPMNMGFFKIGKQPAKLSADCRDCLLLVILIQLIQTLITNLVVQDGVT